MIGERYHEEECGEGDVAEERSEISGVVLTTKVITYDWRAEYY